MPEPGTPCTRAAPVLAGAEPYRVRPDAADELPAELDEIPLPTVSAAKPSFTLNYPQSHRRDRTARLSRAHGGVLARKHGIASAYDNPYCAMITFDDPWRPAFSRSRERRHRGGIPLAVEDVLA